jgi:hypothetical protein
MFQVLIWAFQISIIFGLIVFVVMALTKAGSVGVKGLTQVCIIITPNSPPKTQEQIEDEQLNEFIKQLENK